jgi:hypothetical protein
LRGYQHQGTDHNEQAERIHHTSSCPTPNVERCHQAGQTTRHPQASCVRLVAAQRKAMLGGCERQQRATSTDVNVRRVGQTIVQKHAAGEHGREESAARDPLGSPKLAVTER